MEFFAPLISICALNLAVYLNIRKRSRGLIRSENPQFILANKDLELDKKQENKVTQLNDKKRLSIKINNTLKMIHKSTSSTCSSSSMDESLKQNLNTNGLKNYSALRTSNNDINMEEIERPKNLTPPKNFHLNTHLNESNTTQFLNNTSNKISSTNIVNNNNNNNSNNTNNNSNNTNNNKTNNKPRNKSFTKKNHSTRSNLSKDKKAARSLFILVFVFVCCWVS